jgi:hypothetical protein
LSDFLSYSRLPPPAPRHSGWGIASFACACAGFGVVLAVAAGVLFKLRWVVAVPVQLAAGVMLGVLLAWVFALVFGVIGCQETDRRRTFAAWGLGLAFALPFALMLVSALN